MNRITKQKCHDWGWLYAPTPQKAEILANNQEHDHAVPLVGPIDARDGIEKESVVVAICADIATAASKLQMDTCFYPKDKNSPCLKKLCCTCDNIELNTPIIFETVYRVKDHVLNGQAVYGVMLTGTKRSQIIK